ncbi:FAD-dependent oxidoreductase [Rhodococcus sp. IEGM 248]|uniref:NAD(P)/FAD-dependent oxidoreductase n=1 Tax=Rhodococcus opacus TaxID=37919 RepID=UPI0013BED6E6|nr:FAD-dependent oxidoreductase [Rhodococcus opacus]MDV7090680.1 FAD-dependent oxidoreductase [Rhodococcus opacus]NDV06553.1 FAD-dependent oxidoreductase [Rhodococcus sp. IEGM 248]
MTLNTIVTIGAGQTAAVAARTLRRRGFDGRILLVGDEPHAPYQRPPLSKEFLAGQEDRESLMLLPDAWRDKQNVELLTGTTVTRIDASGGSVELSDGRSVAADAVLVATGGRPRTMPVNGPASERVHYLRTIDDAERLASQLRPGVGLVLIGGGFVGLEIAATAQALGAEVTVLEADAVPLARILGAEMGDVCTRLQRENGVTVRAGIRVDTVTPRPDGVLIALDGGEVLQADVVVVGIGIVPNVEVAQASGLAVDGGILVDAQGRTSIPHVYAAGDVAARFSDAAGRHVRVEHFDNASKQGAATANLMLGRVGVVDPPHWFWSDQFGKNIQFTGTARYTDLVFRGSADDGEFTAFYLDSGVLRGAFSLDRGDEISAARELIGRSIAPGRLADQDVDLFDLMDDDEELVTVS